MQSKSFDLHDWGQAQRATLDAWLASVFADAWPVRFADPLRYPLFGGGKRVRPLLVFAAYRAVTPSAAIARALPCAAAVELVHTYSLVHDDLPCMDDDDERRGRPTVHRAFDEPTAVLVGDALLTHAFALLADAHDLPAEARVRMVARLARDAGYAGMVGGQAADIGLGASITELAVLERLHALKTGALIACSCALGGLAAGATPAQREALDVYGRAVGLAFQLADDVLDADEDAGDDGPPSFVRLLGVDATRARARALANDACDAVAALPQPDALVALARYTVERDV